MKNRLVRVIYVDDTMIAGRKQEDIDNEVKSFGIKYDVLSRTFELRDEWEASSFLYIQIEKTRPA